MWERTSAFNTKGIILASNTNNTFVKVKHRLTSKATIRPIGTNKLINLYRYQWSGDDLMKDRRIRLSDAEIGLIYDALEKSGVSKKLEIRFLSLKLGLGFGTRDRIKKS